MFWDGFCIKNGKQLLGKYRDLAPLRIGGFSYGAQQVWELLKKGGTGRIVKVQLFSPAYFDSLSDRWKKLNLERFKQDREGYLKEFYRRALIPPKYQNWECLHRQEMEEELKKLLTYRWKKIDLTGLDLEVYLGERDRIIDLEGAYQFFKKLGRVYLIKGVGHSLLPEKR